MAYFVHITIENIKYDASVINETGVVRGSIQRVTKLVLSDSIQSSNKMIQDIDQLIEQFISTEEEHRYNGSKENITKGLQNLKEKRQNLEHRLIEYQEIHSEQIKKEIIEESEKCWNAADAVVFAAQLANEDKVAGIKLFYIILTLNAISAILVIFLIFSYVRKKLEYESSHDSLTGLYNRRLYEFLVDSEVARSKRYNKPLSLIKGVK